MNQIDLNSDLGESYGSWIVGNDEEMLKIISSANVACGLHAGDPTVIRQTIECANKFGVDVGAHPGHMDMYGFGRRKIEITDMSELRDMLVYQLSALKGMATSCGTKMTHVKLHGALASQAFKDSLISNALMDAILLVDSKLVLVTTPNNETELAALNKGVAVAKEFLADRAFDDDGIAVPRHLGAAIIHDEILVRDRVVQMVREGYIESISGKRIPMKADTVCVHGDNPNAVKMARAIKNALTDNGISIVPLSKQEKFFDFNTVI